MVDLNESNSKKKKKKKETNQACMSVVWERKILPLLLRKYRTENSTSHGTLQLKK